MQEIEPDLQQAETKREFHVDIYKVDWSRQRSVWSQECLPAPKEMGKRFQPLLFLSCDVLISVPDVSPQAGSMVNNTHLQCSYLKATTEESFWIGGGVYWEDHFPQTWKDSVPSRQEELGRQWCTSSLIRLWTKGRNTISEKFWLKLLEWVKTPGEEVQETRQAE